MSELCVLDPTGDTKHIWNKEKPDEVETMRTLFDSLTKKGYAAFLVTEKGDQGEQIRKFDPSAEKMILVPAMQGG